jgi:threonine dehydrogenase-like Zn-dependent dehydrogenase
MSTMRAVRAYQGITDLAIESIERPELGPDDVLVEVKAAGLAPGMMALLAMGAFRHLPTTVGHEASGIVTAVGDQVAPDLVGKRVRIHPQLGCRSCTYCTTDRDQMCADSAIMGHAAFGSGPMPLYARYHDGGLAEYVRAPWWLVDVLPDNVSFQLGAKVHDLANAVRAYKCAAVPLGSSVIITAATGTMGTSAIKLAPFFGVGHLVLVGRSAERLASVKALAATVKVDTVALDADWAETTQLMEKLGTLAPDATAVLDFFPTGPSIQATAGLATGGAFVHMGGNLTPFLPPPIAFMRNCWRLIGTRSCSRADAREVLSLLGSGALQAEDLITHRFPLDDVNKALAVMRERSEPMWMGVVEP